MALTCYFAVYEGKANAEAQLTDQRLRVHHECRRSGKSRRGRQRLRTAICESLAVVWKQLRWKGGID